MSISGLDNEDIKFLESFAIEHLIETSLDSQKDYKSNKEHKKHKNFLGRCHSCLD